MGDENSFRIALIGLVVVQTLSSFGYIKRSGAASTILRRRNEPRYITIPLVSSYLGYCVGALAYLINPNWMAWSQISIGAWIRWIGFAALIVGTAIILWGLRALGTNLTFVPATKDDHVLITSGPYRWIRHPLYTALMVQVAGIGLLTANWFVAMTGGLTCLFLVLRTGKEEDNLIEHFGDEYRRYMRRVGRFVPRPFTPS